MKMRFFDLAKKVSYKSTHPQHKIGGVLVKKSTILSFGFNKLKTHTKSNHLFKNIHCELDCILGLKKEELFGCTLYLYRQNKSGQVALSKPCRWCQDLLKQVGIHKVCYTGKGTYIEETICG